MLFVCLEKHVATRIEAAQDVYYDVDGDHFPEVRFRISAVASRHHLEVGRSAQTLL